MHPLSRTLVYSLVSIALGLAFGCKSTSKLPVESTQWAGASRLETVKPADIAVVAVRNESAEQRLPLDVLRQALCQGLIEHRYSPLDLGYLDARATEASFSPDKLGADAVLRLAISKVDDVLFRAMGSLFVSGQAQLFDARDPGAAPLWSVSLTRRLELGPVGDRRLGDGDFLERAAGLFARQVTDLLPSRATPVGIP